MFVLELPGYFASLLGCNKATYRQLLEWWGCRGVEELVYCTYLSHDWRCGVWFLKWWTPFSISEIYALMS